MYDFNYKCNLKHKTNEYNKTETEIYITENKQVVAGGEGGGGKKEIGGGD